MAGARYWRINGIQTPGGGDLELSELQLYDSAGQVDVVPTCSMVPVSGSLANLSDSDTATLCRFSADQWRAAGFWLQWDAVSTVEVFAVRYGGGANADECVEALLLSSSDDGVTWSADIKFGRLPWSGPNTLSPIPVVGDSSFNSVQLLLHGDEATDYSNAARSVSLAGATVSTANSLFGDSSFLFAGANVITVGDDAALRVGASDFTLELAVYPTSVSATAILCNKANNMGAPYPWQLYFTSGGALKAWGYNTGPEWSIAGGTVSASTWSRICLERNGSTIRLYLNGAVVGTTTYTGALPDAGALAPISIGAYSGGSYGFFGYIDEVRFAIGVARYKGAYTLASAEFENYSVLLGGGMLPPRTRTPATRRHLAYSSAIPATASVRSNRASRWARDMEFGGRARIIGDVGIKGASGAPDTMTKSRVRLLRARDGLLARETWSDPVTGAFEFTDLDERTEFIALAQDGTGSFRPVAADRVLPEVPA